VEPDEVGTEDGAEDFFANGEGAVDL